MIDLTTVEQIASIGTAIGTITLVFLFWKTIMQLEETVKLSRIQSTHRFRPWVGPLDSIKPMSTTPEGREQFSITIKNYGELPTSNVIVSYMIKNHEFTREILKKSDGIEDFSLGPLLPNMEKRYWFFVDSQLIKQVKDGTGQVFILLYFRYEFPAGKSGYGMISRYDPKISTFVHKDMWVD